MPEPKSRLGSLAPSSHRPVETVWWGGWPRWGRTLLAGAVSRICDAWLLLVWPRLLRTGRTGRDRYSVSVATKMQQLLVLLSTSNLIPDHMYYDTYYTNHYQSVHMWAWATCRIIVHPLPARCRVLSAACWVMAIFTTWIVVVVSQPARSQIIEMYGGGLPARRCCGSSPRD